MGIREANKNRVLQNGSTKSERDRNFIKQSILKDFNIQPTYIKISKNETLQEFQLINNEKVDVYKYLLTKPDEIINAGDVIDIGDTKWICVLSELVDLGNYYKGTIQQANNTLKFYNKTGISSTAFEWKLCEVPCIINTPFKTNMGINQNDLISTFSKDYEVIIPDNSETKSIIEETRFILKDPISSENDEVYKVEGKNKWSTNGLKILKLSISEFDPDDNRELGIANYYSHQNKYEVTILNGYSIKKFYGDNPFQLNVACKLNGEDINNPNVTYSSQDTRVCTVSSTGLVTLIGTGTTNVKVSYGNTEAIINIESNITTQYNYNIILTPSNTTIKTDRALTLNAFVTNGIDNVNKQVGFEISNVDGSDNVYVTYTTNGNSITLKSGSLYNKFVKLKVYMIEFPNVYVERQIKIINLI